MKVVTKHIMNENGRVVKTVKIWTILGLRVKVKEFYYPPKNADVIDL